ncbi:MAG: hypothetical protein ACRDTH_02490 [Pseudonocardiaceae bacterium]
MRIPGSPGLGDADPPQSVRVLIGQRQQPGVDQLIEGPGQGPRCRVTAIEVSIPRLGHTTVGALPASVSRWLRKSTGDNVHRRPVFGAVFTG